MNEARDRDEVRGGDWERLTKRFPHTFEGKTETQIDIIRLIYSIAWNDGASYVNQNITDEIKEVKV